jgi:hypothetical protein
VAYLCLVRVLAHPHILRLLRSVARPLRALAGVKLVGAWRAASAENAAKIRFDADHTFTGGKLVLNFRGEAHHPKQSELVLTVRDDDHIVLRQSSGLETTLERLSDYHVRI